MEQGPAASLERSRNPERQGPVGRDVAIYVADGNAV
jgi:hypothetical protein